MAICTEKPDVPLDAIGLEAVSDQPHYPLTRGGSGRHRTSSAAMPPPISRQASMSGFKPNTPGGFTMGNFSTPTSKMTSEERFAMSQRSTSSTVSGSGMPFGRSGQMTRTSSQGGPGSNRTRSKRGGERNESNKVHASNAYNQATKDQNVNLEPIAPLEFSANRWTRKSVADEEQNVERKVRSLLNKLTMEKFDAISDQIIEWANKSEAEKDGRTLIHVIRLVFEKATDEAAWSEMYARLCRKMMETISPNVQDDGIRNTEGKPITGGQLFRKYLLNRCQEDFERGWAAKDAAAKISEGIKKVEEASSEVELYSDEYYAAQKAKRQGLGLIQFIGELYKLRMLTERIMHECIKKLLGNVDNPEEEEIESLCRLLTTVGRLLDNPKARAHMDIYFTRMKELGKSSNVAPRMQFMLQVSFTVYARPIASSCLFSRTLSSYANGSGSQGTKLRLQLRSPRFTRR
jgi:translation initiation factor 4G